MNDFAVLQQTRVATVIAYWNNWTDKWPTIQDLAKASSEDVLAAWRGLGYYSRATRIHQAAQKVSSDPALDGLLPETAAELEKVVPGVGRYTAGAISSIVFGRAEAILDGNVARVLSRQLAFHANPKNKATTDFLWDVAQRIVEAVAGHGKDDAVRSEKPSFWNQAVMELGATVCTPQQPKCNECPIQGTCRAFAEGERLAISKGEMHQYQARSPLNATEDVLPDVTDIEDLCASCEPFPEGLAAQQAGIVTGVLGDDSTSQEGADGSSNLSSPSLKRKAGVTASQGDAAKLPAKKQQKQASLLSHFKKAAAPARPLDEIPEVQVEESLLAGAQKSAADSLPLAASKPIPHRALETIQSHVRLYPMKAAKTVVREEACAVCIIKRQPMVPDGSAAWLLQQRPDKGLLASLWEFPTLTLDDTTSGSTSKRRKAALVFAQAIVGEIPLTDRGESGQLTHVFSHLKLKMYVHSFELRQDECSTRDASIGDTRRTWNTTQEVEEESMGTGMRNCWALVKPAGKENQGKKKSQAPKAKRR